MLTGRAWWFLVTVSLLLAAGLLGRLVVLTLLGLSLLAWFAWEWLLFAIRVSTVVRQLRITRAVLDERGPVATLWAGRAFQVCVALRLRGSGRLPFVAVTDRIPFGVEPLRGAASTDGPVTASKPLELTYRIRCLRPGLARFEGLRVQIADLQGFFYHATFVPGVLLLRILPPLVDDKGHPAGVKRHNLLPPPGIHRVRRPGSGSELLDLRDYVPGDPPKTIAWKVSARRDRLITKEFESEVPIRCTLFVDTSNSVRLATAEGKPLTRLVDIAAAVLQASAGIRDLTGLCLFDEHGSTAVRPDRSGSHLTQMLQLLADAAALTPRHVRADPEPLLPLAYAFAQEVYPYLMRPAINSMPFWHAWAVAFSGNPRRRVGLWEYLHRHKEEMVVLCWWSSFWSVVLPSAMLISKWLFGVDVPDDTFLVASVLSTAASAVLWSVTGLFFMLDSLASGKRRRLERWRKRLGALLTARHGLGAGGLSALLEDDDQFSLHVQRFLADHQVPYALPLYDPEGRYQFAAPEKVGVLSEALLRAVGRGHDNELFVLLADLLELDDHLEPLLKAVRVALSRHHQVLLVCPWPPGLEPPSSSENRGSNAGSSRSAIFYPSSTAPKLRKALLRATERRFHSAYQRVRRGFARLGVQVVCAAGDEPVPLILDRLERLRTLRRKP